MDILSGAATNSSAPLDDVDVEKLDYKYIGECQNPAELKAILKVLESGKHGRYFDLEKFTEDRIMELLPKNEAQRWRAMTKGPTFDEESEARRDIEQWLASVEDSDQKLKKRASGNVFAPSLSRNIPPVRGKTTQNISHQEEEDGEVEQKRGSTVAPPPPKAKKADPRKMSFQQYYRQWESFDVEKEEKKIEEIDAKKKVAAAPKLTPSQEKQRSENRKQILQELKLSVDPSTLSDVERKKISEQEKIKGNEHFKSGDNDEALTCYSRSLLLDPSNHIVYANRAMTSLRMDQLRQAEEDATTCIELCPEYAKGWFRRGVARHRRGRYLEAIHDFERALTLEPKNKELQRMLTESRKKYVEVEGDCAEKEQVEKLGIKKRPKPAVKEEVEEEEEEEEEGFHRVSIDFGGDTDSESEEEESVAVPEQLEEPPAIVEPPAPVQSEEPPPVEAPKAEVPSPKRKKKLVFEEPKSMFDFERLWTDVRSNPRDVAEFLLVGNRVLARAHLLQSFKEKKTVAKLHKLFTSAIESDMLESLISATRNFVLPGKNKLFSLKLLREISKTGQFGLTKALATSQTMEDVRFIIESGKGAKSSQTQALAEKMDKAYS